MFIDLSKIISIVPELLYACDLVAQQIIDIRNKDGCDILAIKSDDSPLSAADRISHDVLFKKLRYLIGAVPVISEENWDEVKADEQVITQGQQYWLLDPLDGTKEYLQNTDEFCINIALIEHNQPIFGLITLPIAKISIWALKDYGAFIHTAFDNNINGTKLAAQPFLLQPTRVAVSRKHNDNDQLERYLQGLQEYQVSYYGSALKFCLIAQGLIDLYPRFKPTAFWDIAAGQCIVEALGGAVVDLTGNSLTYDLTKGVIFPSFIAMRRLEDLQQFLSLANNYNGCG